MNCQEVMELMQRNLDMDLDDMDQQVMTQHLQSCSACAAMFERLNHLSFELEKLPKVVPPYSLVNSILPQLEQIDLQGIANFPDTMGAGQAVTRETSTAVMPWMQRVKQRFPFKSTGGVIAAGIVLGLIMVSYNPFTATDKAADEILMEKAASSSESADSASTENNSDMKLKSFTLEDTAKSDADASQDVLTEAPQAAYQEDPQADSPDTPVSSNDRMFSTDYQGNPASKEPTPLETTSSPDGSDVSGGFSGTGEAEEAGERVGSMDETPGDPAEEAAVQPKGKVQAPFMATANSESIASPDGSYSALIEGMQVVVINKNNERIYVSPSKDADQILNLKWSDDSKYLHYETAAGESIVAFRIDVANKTELQQ